MAKSLEFRSLIAKPHIYGFYLTLASAFFLLYALWSPLCSLAQDSEDSLQQVDSFIEIQGISADRDQYYRNLIIQDIALPQLIPVDKIVFHLDYQLGYGLNKVAKDSYEIRVIGQGTQCAYIDYFGFNVSAAVIPKKANLTFWIKNQYGFIEDSLVLNEVPFNDDAGLYASKSYRTNIIDPLIEFKGVEFIFEEEAYEYFRAEISKLDDYYAATILLDSLQQWAEEYFPAGDGSVWGNFLQQLEMRRILDYIDSSSFHALLINGFNDRAGYFNLREKADRLLTRVNTILERQIKEETDGIDKQPALYWVNKYYDWIRKYETLASSSPYRFSNYFSGLGSLRFSSGMLFHQQKFIKTVFEQIEERLYYQDRLFLIAKPLSGRFMEDAASSVLTGEIVKSIDLYDNAIHINKKIPGSGDVKNLVEKVNQLRFDLASSYLNLAKMAAIKENVYITESYLDQARNILSPGGTDEEMDRLHAVEKEIFDLFFGHATGKASSYQYQEALDILSFLTRMCSSHKYDCTGELYTLMKEVEQGRYQQLLNKAGILLNEYEPEEARKLLEKSIELRYASLGTIQRDRKEFILNSRLNQIKYDEEIADGIRHLNFRNPEIALYYFNSARVMEGKALVKKDPRLPDFLRESAKPLIIDMIDLGRARARGYFFEESWEIIGKCKEMIHDYQLKGDTAIWSLMLELDSILRSSQCEKLQRDYDELLTKSRTAKESENYIDAMKHVNRAIEIVLNDTVCEINDLESWYMRAVLEYPVDYMKRKQRALSHIPGNAEGFTKAYHDLEQYYLAMGLQDEGVVFIPMIERVLQEKDKYFLTNMLSHYIAQKEREDALSVMNLLWEEHNYAPGKTQQKRLAEWLAREDIKSGCTDPIGCLYDYVPVNPSFKTFKYYYKLTWVKESGSKFRHLSLFLKNKPADK